MLNGLRGLDGASANIDEGSGLAEVEVEGAEVAAEGDQDWCRLRGDSRGAAGRGRADDIASSGGLRGVSERRRKGQDSSQNYSRKPRDCFVFLSVSSRVAFRSSLCGSGEGRARYSIEGPYRARQGHRRTRAASTHPLRRLTCETRRVRVRTRRVEFTQLKCASTAVCSIARSARPTLGRRCFCAICTRGRCRTASCAQ